MGPAKAMLTLDRAREILGREAPTDDRQLELMVVQTDQFARLLVELFRAGRLKKVGETVESTLKGDA